MSDELTSVDIKEVVKIATEELTNAGEKLSDVFCDIVDNIFGK